MANEQDGKAFEAAKAELPKPDKTT